MHRTDPRIGWKVGGEGRTRLAFAAVAWMLLMAVLAGTTPGAAEAQVTWETPRLLGTDVPRGLGAYYADFGALGGDGTGVLVTWTGALAEGLRLRGGWAEGAGGDGAGFGGLDLWRPLTDRTEELPVDVVWTSGIGVGHGAWTLVSVPVGLSAGRSLQEGPVWISPWVHAGVVFDLQLGNEAPEDEFRVGVATDLGVHVSFDEARRVVLSASAGLGDRQAWAVGLVLRP